MFEESDSAPQTPPPAAPLPRSLSEGVLPVALLEAMSVGVGAADRDVVDALSAVSAVESRLAAHKAKLIAELIRRQQVVCPGGPEVDPVQCPGREQVAAALKISCRSAQIEVDHAQRLMALPRTLSALAEGVLTTRAAKVMVAQTLDLSDVQISVVEADVVDYACTHTPAEVKRRVTRTLYTLFPAVQEAQQVAAAAGREVVMYPAEHGMAVLEALLPCHEANLVFGYLNRAADVLKTQDRDQLKTAGLPTNELASRGTYRADALVALVAARWGTPTHVQAQESSNQNQDQSVIDESVVITGESVIHDVISAGTIVNIVMDLPTAVGLADNPGQLQGYGPIPGTLARELAADARWRRWITDEHGTLTAVGTTRYRPPDALRQFVIARDQRCRFPGCHQPAQHCDLDHAMPYDQGGPTDASNLGALCRRHHRIKTTGGWNITNIAPDRTYTWSTPTGKHIHQELEPLLPTTPTTQPTTPDKPSEHEPNPAELDSQTKLKEPGFPS